MDKKQNRDISGSGEQTTSEAMETTAADTTWTKNKTETSAAAENRQHPKRWRQQQQQQIQQGQQSKQTSAVKENTNIRSDGDNSSRYNMDKNQNRHQR
ncbi:hypothetical protein ACOMHN_013774 [Nucella lapillus]